jgi:hypothetical protein
MRVRRLVFASVLVVVGSVAAGCGGAQDKPPGPLGRHFDQSFIAGQSLDDKQPVLKAQGDYNSAQMEQAKAQADEREAGTMLDVAKNEQAAARLDEKSAKSRKQAADQSADQNRINDATKEQRGAELARRAAEQRVKYLEAYQKWLHVLLRYTQENTFWQEARYQLAQARLAKSKNIQPKGFKYDDYVKQEQDRAGRTATAKQKADSAKARALAERTNWLAIQGEADKTLGKASSFPDPMAPHPGPTGPATSGGGGYTLGSQGAKSDQSVPKADDATKVPAPAPEPANGDGSGSGSGSDQ